MNGFNGGFYNTLVTLYAPDEMAQYYAQVQRTIYKKNGDSQSESRSEIPSYLNESPFFKDRLAQPDAESKPQNVEGQSQRWDKAIAAATRNYNAEKTVERATGAKENTASEGGVKKQDYSYDGLPVDVFYTDGRIYEYDFLVSQKPMQVYDLPPLSAVKVDSKVNRDKAAEIGLANAKAAGLPQGKPDSEIPPIRPQLLTILV